MWDEMRMRTACFARAPQRCTSRLSQHFRLTFQEVTLLSKTRNPLSVFMTLSLSPYIFFRGNSTIRRGLYSIHLSKRRCPMNHMAKRSAVTLLAVLLGLGFASPVFPQ